MFGLGSMCFIISSSAYSSSMSAGEAWAIEGRGGGGRGRGRERGKGGGEQGKERNE